MADELIIIKENDTVFIKSLDQEIFNSRVDEFLNQGYQLIGQIEISNHGLCKAHLSKK
jgi:hypothetical protein|tara:strand:- start:282 stop:455 length:174 start_codon:yes stop_codon:yes gene_type:complete